MVSRKRPRWLRITALTSLAASGLSLFGLAAGCGTTNSRVTYAGAGFTDVTGQYEQFTRDSLAAEGATIDKEADVPWRRGVAYEALSQTLSLARVFATALGWSATEFEKSQKLITLDSEDTELSAIKTRYQPEFTDVAGHRASDFDLIVPDLLKIKQLAPLTARQQLNAVLGTGSDPLDGNMYMRDFYNVTYEGINFQDKRYGEIRTLKNDIVSALDQHPIRVTPLIDATKPGEGLLYVHVYNTPYARILPLANLSPVYPIISEAKIESLVPLIRELMASLVTYFHAPEILPFFDDRLVPPFLIDLIKFFETVWTRFSPNAFDGEIVRVLRTLNNGSFHFLAIEAFVRGLAGDFFVSDEAQPARAATNLVNGVDPKRGLPGMSAMAAARMKNVYDFLPYARFPSLVVGPASTTNQGAYQYLDSPQQFGYLAYFLEGGQDLLTRNGVARAS